MTFPCNLDTIIGRDQRLWGVVVTFKKRNYFVAAAALAREADGLARDYQCAYPDARVGVSLYGRRTTIHGGPIELVNAYWEQ